MVPSPRHRSVRFTLYILAPGACGGHASAWFSPFWRGPAPGAQRYQAPSSDEERDTTDAETDADTAAEEAWCPPMPDAPDDPTEI